MARTRFHEYPIAGNRLHGVILRTPGGWGRPDISSYDYWKSDVAVELFGRPDFLAGRVVLAALTPPHIAPVMDYLVPVAVKHVLNGLRQKSIVELAAGVIVEYGRQVAGGAPTLSIHGETAKRYIPYGVFYLFLEAPDAAAFANNCGGSVF